MNFKPEKKLGFGLMRLPKTEEEKTIDIEQVCEMADEFLSRGFTYFDTAYVYDNGDSERAFREAVVKRHPRETYTLATKLPAWCLHEQSDVKRIFDEQLKNTGLEYFDYYLLHSVETGWIPVYDKFDCWNFCLQMKAEGKIRHFGFSFHDKPEVLDDVLSKHPEVEFVQLQLNYLDWENNLIQSRACYETAVKHGVSVIVMEPVKGGTLAKMDEKTADIFRSEKPDASMASWALRFCGSLDHVMVVLSGMSDRSQMEDNLNTMDGMEPLSSKEQQCIVQVREALLSMPVIPCTACRYCTAGCPMGIRIPDIFSCINNVRLYGANMRANGFYQRYTEGAAKASACIACGQCEGVCPQHLKIIDILKEAVEDFEKESK